MIGKVKETQAGVLSRDIAYVRKTDRQIDRQIDQIDRQRGESMQEVESVCYAVSLKLQR